MSNQKYYKTIITVEILSDFPYSYGFDLRNVWHDMTYGPVSGKIGEDCKEISREEMESLLIAQGSDPSFILENNYYENN
jgi:hypothetical protein